jgi:hypothetical protein
MITLIGCWGWSLSSFCLCVMLLCNGLDGADSDPLIEVVVYTQREPG